MAEFEHEALNLTQRKKIVFIAMSKHMFYFKEHAVKFVLEKGFTPISQYNIFDYFLLDTVDRNLVRNANNNLIHASDELWVFGPISDGVLAEIKLFHGKKSIRYFRVNNSKDIEEISSEEVEFEDGLERFSNEL